MSDDLAVDEPDLRDHRCRPPAVGSKHLAIGSVFACECATRYRLTRSPFGEQWLPAPDADATLTIRRPRGR